MATLPAAHAESSAVRASSGNKRLRSAEEDGVQDIMAPADLSGGASPTGSNSQPASDSLASLAVGTTLGLPGGVHSRKISTLTFKIQKNDVTTIVHGA